MKLTLQIFLLIKTSKEDSSHAVSLYMNKKKISSMHSLDDQQLYQITRNLRNTLKSWQSR